MYRQLMTVLIIKKKAERLAFSGVALAYDRLTVKEEKKSTTAPIATEGEQLQAEKKMQFIFKQVYPFFNKNNTYKLKENIDGIEATLSLSIQCEQGKINLNSLYDFETKKFIGEGKPTDRKKVANWLLERLSSLTKTPGLFTAFEKHLSTRTHDFNDVTELLIIPEFQKAFDGHVFLQFKTKKDKAIIDGNKDPLYLTDIFTVSTEQDTVNPWLFSKSWCTILGLKEKKELSDEEKIKIFGQLKAMSNWETDWNNSLKILYQKDYKDVPAEIKTMLTTQFEANIFSLLLEAKIKETSSTIFIIVKSNTKNNLTSFDILKTYQI